MPFFTRDFRVQVSYNWCDADDAVFAVYYLDNGSSRWDVFQNVASNSPLPWCYFMTGGGGPSGKASNSSVSKLWCQDTSPGRNDCADLGCTVDDSSVLCVQMLRPLHALVPCVRFLSHARCSYLKASDRLPDPAQSIINSSGCQMPSCRNL